MNTTLSERLKEARVESGLTQAALAERAGVDQSTIATLETGERKGTKQIVAIARALGVEPDWLSEGHGFKRREADVIDLEPIWRFKESLNAGVDGCPVEDTPEEKPLIFFLRDWIQSRGWKAENLVAMRVGSSSMEPNFWEDDLVVINIADKELKDNQVFAMFHENVRVIKRMRRIAGQWWLASDNSDKTRYPDVPCTEGTQIIGKAVYKQSEVM
jgi:phage repressor protein C with HTH and peptisase S24 domain